jgi:hypothetical protein
LSQGFTTKSVAPSFIALTARSASAYAVIITTTAEGSDFSIRFSQYRPSLPVLIPAEKFMSSKMTSYLSLLRQLII